ncbi:MAG: hypothetical protein NVS4B3_10630 [Gemmatimonadaceae bacterium]
MNHITFGSVSAMCHWSLPPTARAAMRFLSVVVIVAVAACARPMVVGSASRAAESAAPAAVAKLQDPSGRAVGAAQFYSGAAGTRIVVTASHLSPGNHGMHVHGVGRCTPDFAAAGPHFNPTQRKHGRDNPEGFHAGDLPNLTVGPDSAGTAVVTTSAVTLDSGPAGLFDADGSALIIHASADDNRTDPAGNSGARIACGVIER